jgi:hypothetical protein
MSADNVESTGKVYMASIFAVSDFDRWQSDLHRARRALTRLGVTRHWIFRGSDDPKEIMSILELPSRDHAERLLASSELDLPGWMDRIGLEIYPTFFVGERIDIQEYPSLPPRPAPSAD